jgi:hypothetical protein
MKLYKVDTTNKPSPSQTWNPDFRADCEETNYIYEVVNEKYTPTQILIQNRVNGKQWSHLKQHGHFIDDTYIDDKLFEL